MGMTAPEVPFLKKGSKGLRKKDLSPRFQKAWPAIVSWPWKAELPVVKLVRAVEDYRSAFNTEIRVRESDFGIFEMEMAFEVGDGAANVLICRLAQAVTA